jgi:anti-sigma regulatory factor (Ser/Thr protein kinase)
MLDVIERSTGDPQALAALAAVGQISMQMRRHADGLLVLSGGSLARSFHAPLPLGDLIRAATADVDDGSRMMVVSDSPDAVKADAAADVLHLVAELAENAARHTPQLAEVTIRTSRVGRGVLVEVDDHGPGFAPEALEHANAVLADPPDVGLAVGDGLGLMVVARLAARHGIMVSLRSSPTAGTTAIVILPHAIMVTGEVRDTVADRSLPRIDDQMLPTAAPSASSIPPTVPQRVVDQDTTQPSGRVAPYVQLKPVVTAAAAAREESAPPWHWLTASRPPRTPAPVRPRPAATEPGDAGDREAPVPLPRRIRPSGPQLGLAVPAVPASADASRSPAGEPAEEPGQVPAEQPAEQPAEVPAEEVAEVRGEQPAEVPAAQPAGVDADSGAGASTGAQPASES